MTRTPLGLTLRVGALVIACASARAAGAQTLGPVALFAGVGASWQQKSDFDPVGPQLWVGAETVLDRRLRVRLDASLQRFGYRASPPPCPPGKFCAPTITSALELVAITGTIVWRDTTYANLWYAVAGLGAYSDANGRDANSRVGINAGLGRTFTATHDWFVEARVELPYDPYGYGVFVPVTIGRRFAGFTP